MCAYLRYKITLILTSRVQSLVIAGGDQCFFARRFVITQVCDQPHPGVVLEILKSCVKGDCSSASHRMKALHDTGYSSNDIIGTVFRVRH